MDDDTSSMGLLFKAVTGDGPVIVDESHMHTDEELAEGLKRVADARRGLDKEHGRGQAAGPDPDE